jgi:hypothetical protein
LALEADFSFNLNVRLLKQLASLETALESFTALTDGSALGKLKEFVNKLSEIPNLFLRVDVATLLGLAQDAGRALFDASSIVPQSPILDRLYRPAGACPVIWDTVILMGDFYRLLPSLLDALNVTSSDQSTASIVQRLILSAKEYQFPVDTVVKLRDLSCQIPDIVKTVGQVLDGAVGSSHNLLGIRYLITVAEQMSDLLEAFKGPGLVDTLAQFTDVAKLFQQLALAPSYLTVQPSFSSLSHFLAWAQGPSGPFGGFLSGFNETWSQIQHTFADAQAVFETLQQARSMLGTKFARGFPTDLCASSAAITKGGVTFSVEADSAIVTPLSGVLVSVVEDEAAGSFVVLKRTSSPLRGKFVKIGPLVLASKLRELNGTTLPLKTSLGSIFPGAPVCAVSGLLSLQVQACMTALCDTLEDVDLVAMVRTPVLERLKALAKIDASLPQNLAYLEIGGAVLINRQIINTSFIIAYGVPLAKKKLSAIRDAEEDASGASNFASTTAFDLHTSTSLYSALLMYYQQAFLLQLGPVPVAVLVQLQGNLNLDAELTLKPFAQTLQVSERFTSCRY